MTENKRAGRNIKIIVTEELPEGVSEDEYQIIEKHEEDKSEKKEEP